MWYMALFMVACFIISSLLKRNIEETDKKENVLVRDVSAIYVGGFPDVEGGSKAHIVVKKETINILFGGVMIQGQKSIPMSSVINAETKSETQITKDVSLGKLIVFGVLAFAMKDSKTTVKNYLVISCNDSGKRRDYIFETSLAVRIIGVIKDVLSHR